MLTKLNCGSTAGPTSAASYLRGGHSLGGSKNVYVVQEKASNQFCGRLLGDFDEHSAKFAASNPDFISIDPLKLKGEWLVMSMEQTRRRWMSQLMKHCMDFWKG